MNKSDYRTVYLGGTGEITEKKSRFIATVLPVKEEAEALAFIEQMKKTYWDATHNCSAYVLGLQPELQRCSDDGEPQKTAGRPMLEVLIREELRNTAVVVTRYFGGTLLGTGGLVRAYTEAVNAGLANCTIIHKRYGHKFRIGTDYNGIGKLQYLAAQHELPVLHTAYTDAVSYTVFLTPEMEDTFFKRLSEQTNGKAVIEQLDECFFSYVNNTPFIFPD